MTFLVWLNSLCAPQFALDVFDAGDNRLARVDLEADPEIRAKAPGSLARLRLF
jgi:hypothetical protein